MSSPQLFSVHPYTSQDYEAAVDLMTGLQLHLAEIDTTGHVRAFSNRSEGYQYIDQGLKDIQEMHGACFVAKIQETVIGFILGITTDHEGQTMHVLGHKPSKDAWIGMLFVDPTYRKIGVVQALFARFKEFALQEKCDSLRLKVAIENAHAIDVYTHYGFRAVETEMMLKIQ